MFVLLDIVYTVRDNYGFGKLQFLLQLATRVEKSSILFLNRENRILKNREVGVVCFAKKS